ncbi:HAMP domain-containing sensor histidine kinase [Caulobacter sp.]|uniref:HAMP domain-containing sensor histidine kinase n=1 Tax=Caulobacter sp. TaxID=78 RepID=UPI002B474819|nr:HAMP domain-containing sensor histidine kinase [Caulobacter sp.]HJV43606.1 HAMP domain-containing sensor histidine kinase [Caulobacter sp.]
MSQLWTSFRTRLIAGAVIWIIVGLTVSGFLLSELFKAHVTQQFDDELHGHAAELAALIGVAPDGKLYLHRRLSDPRFLPRNSGFYWRVEAESGVAIDSPSLAGRPLPLPGPFPPPGVERHVFVAGPSGQLRLVERAVAITGAPPLRIGIGVDQRLLDEVLGRFNWTLFLSLTIVALGLAAAAILQVWFGLRPLSRMRHALSAVRMGRASRLPEDLPSEVRPLAVDLNALLEGNLEMLRRARTQAGNLAHALKTPLAILMDEAERLRAAGQDEAAEVIGLQCERMRRQIDYQIARARAAALKRAPGVAAEVRGTLEPIIAAMSRLHGRRGVTYNVTYEDEPIVAVDAQDLGEILANVLDNAGKWAEARVEVSVRRSGQSVEIMVDDDGPGLPPESYEHVFGVGERLDERTPGHGLGLSIVKDLVGLYEGRITLDASPRRGLRLTLVFPTIDA